MKVSMGIKGNYLPVVEEAPTFEHTQKQLEHYLNVVAAKHSGPGVEKNKRIARDILVAIGKTLVVVGIGTAFFILTADPTQAATVFAPSVPADTGLIDLGPLKILEHKAYITMLEAMGIILAPVYAWCGFVVVGAGTNTGKRTMGKQLAIWSTVAALIVAAAPWAGAAMMKLARFVFNV